MLARRLIVLALALLVCRTAAAQEAPAGTTPVPATGRFTYSFGLNYMLQASARRDYPFRDQRFVDDESFVWWRLRPSVSARSRHLDLVLEGQDTHARTEAEGGAFGARKAWLDLMNAYVDIKNLKGATIRVGRQQADFEVLGRMVRTSDFVAVIRSFDVVSTTWQNRSTDLRAYVMKPVDNLPSSFNKQKAGEYLWSVYGRRTLAPRTTLSSYVIARHNDDGSLIRNEAGTTGAADVYAWLVQVEGPTPSPLVTWTAETVLERGTWAGDDVRAWAMFLRADVALGETGHTIDVRYNQTSGDAARGDGVRGQFDTFYGAANVYGALGQFRGNNLKNFNVGGLLSLVKGPRPLTMNWRYWNSRLNTRADLWHGVINPSFSDPAATSSLAGHETALLLSWQATPKTMIRTGYFQFIPGPYATRAQGRPYELRLQVIGRL